MAKKKNRDVSIQRADEDTYTTVVELLQDHLTTRRSSVKRVGGYVKVVRKLEKIEGCSDSFQRWFFTYSMGGLTKVWCCGGGKREREMEM
jgi:hypothetical protein